MSTRGYTIDGLAPRGDRSVRRSPAWPLIGLAAATLLLLLLNGWLWVAGSSRAGAAVDRVAEDARVWRNGWAEREAAAKAAMARKGRKGKAANQKSALVAPLPEDDLPVAELKAQSTELEAKLAGFQPDGVYIVIDTANNRLYMKSGADTLLDAICSTGSYSKLEAPDGRSWFFHTPRGQFRIQNKKQDPVWVKPDWAFVEENEPIPGARSSERYEPYVMGDYAMGFGNGYYIHGTLYRRLLGQSVTHGCVRLGDQELEQVYRTAPIGTPIFIY
jgi:lipoprotein-anchoring transpeptidase ErfK/SrfK